MIGRYNGFLFALAFIAAIGAVHAAEQSNMPGSRVQAEFLNGDGKNTGSVVLTQTAHGVLVDADLRGLEAGWHGFHVHEKGECRVPDFESAGDHYNPEDSEHGFMATKGRHAGDLPNIFVAKDGTARIQFLLDKITLHDGERALFDNDGSAIVVHSRADDYRSQPSGDAGSRVACVALRGSTG